MSRLLPDVRWLGLTRVLVLSDRLWAEYWLAGLRSRRVVAQIAWPDADVEPLASALQALMAKLPASRWQRIELYLADRHVHLLQLPAMASSLQTFSWSGEEQLAYARAVLMQTYGEAARAWPSRLQDIRAARSCLLATIPALQSVDLSTLLTKHAVQWSVQPYVCALWAQARLPENGTVLTAESQMLRLLQFQHGHIVHVASLAVDLFEVEAITAWLMRERTLLGVQASACYWLMAPGCDVMALTGGRLKQALSAHLTLQTLYAAHPVTTLWQEAMHVA